MTDRELLELAAKAAGMVVHAGHQNGRDACGAGDIGLWIVDGASCWNPLTNDGDALRLAVKLRLQITIAEGVPEDASSGDAVECAATRRAIVRAAAEIGRVTL